MTRNDIAQLLPEIFQRTLEDGNPLDLLLDVMEAQHAPSELALGTLDAFFNPHRAPDAFVPFLATWVDLGALLREAPTLFEGDTPPLATGIGRLRELVAAAAYLSQWRGTFKGLLRFLETATGVSGFTIDEAVPGETGAAIPYHIRVTAPASVTQFRPMIDHIIDMEKPAYVTYDLTFKRPA